MLIFPTVVTIKYGLSAGLVNFVSILLVYMLLADNALIEAIKLPFLAIKLRTKISEADELLKKLKKLGEITGECNLALLASTQLVSTEKLSFSGIDELIERVGDVMNDLGIDNNRIKEMRESWGWNYLCRNKYFNKLIPANDLSVKEGARTFREMKEIEDRRKFINDVLNFLERNIPNYDPQVFDNLKHFIETGEHRDKSVLLDR